MAGTMTSPVGYSNIFLAKLSSAGQYVWQKSIQDSDAQHCPSVAVDSNDNVVLTSQIRLNADIGGATLTTTNTTLQDVFVARYRSDGAYSWAKRYTGTSESLGNDVAVDGANIIFTGWLNGTVDFGAGAVVNGTNGARAAIAVKIKL